VSTAPNTAEAAARTEPEPPEASPAEASSVETSSTDPVPAEPPSAEPAIKPILIGEGNEPAAEKKRGWWRR
jgi:hypothetical protein